MCVKMYSTFYYIFFFKKKIDEKIVFLNCGILKMLLRNSIFGLYKTEFAMVSIPCVTKISLLKNR